LNQEDNNTFDRLRELLVKEFEITPDLVQPTARMDQLAIDSLALIEVMFRLEDEFKIDFPQEPGELQTVGDLVTCIDRLAAEQRLQKPAGAPAP
jgi:acyl carrier protein